MIILNIILIIALAFLVLYILKKNKNSTENVCVNNKCSAESNEDNQNNNLNSERVRILFPFAGSIINTFLFLKSTSYITTKC